MITIQHNHKQSGFTMIELLVAATIIVVLSAIGMVSFSQANKNARDGKRKADMESVRSALELYRSAGTSYPPGGAAASGTTGWTTMMGALYPNYISVSSLVDPKADATHNYTYTSPAGNKTYTVCAALLENVASSYCLNNP